MNNAVENKDARDSEGKYKHDGNWDRLCKCGHTLGFHAAAKVAGQRPCFHGDEPGAEPCGCVVFRKA